MIDLYVSFSIMEEVIKMIIYLIRHGETEANKQMIIQGRANNPLNQTGKEQAKQTAMYLKKLNIDFDFCVTSPLKRSIDTANIIKDNLKLKLKNHIEPEIIEREHLSQDDLTNILKTSNNKIKIIFANNNIFNLSSDFKETTFDISYHSFFKHHLSAAQKEEIDNILQEKSNMVFEYDGVYNISGMIIQALYSWKDPVLLNGAVFSNLLYPNKGNLEKNKQNGKLKFYKFGNFFTYRGTYLKTYSKAWNRR